MEGEKKEKRCQEPLFSWFFVLPTLELVPDTFSSSNNHMVFLAQALATAEVGLPTLVLTRYHVHTTGQ